MAIKNIIFDYGNVIFTIDFTVTQQAFADLGIRNAGAFFGHKAHHPIFDQFEKGLLSPEEFREAFREAGALQLSDDVIDKAWNSLLIGVPEGNHECLFEVKKKYRTFLLSNNNEIHYQWILQHLQTVHGLENNASFFEKAYYSHQMGMRKPDVEIFRHVIDTHQLNPAETLFIDDSPQHIAGAKKIGLQTVLMRRPADELSLLLKELGVL